MVRQLATARVGCGVKVCEWAVSEGEVGGESKTERSDSTRAGPEEPQRRGFGSCGARVGAASLVPWMLGCCLDPDDIYCWRLELRKGKWMLAYLR